MPFGESSRERVADAPRFRTTRWSLVVRAGADSAVGLPALEELRRDDGGLREDDP